MIKQIESDWEHYKMKYHVDEQGTAILLSTYHAFMAGWLAHRRFVRRELRCRKNRVRVK